MTTCFVSEATAEANRDNVGDGEGRVFRVLLYCAILRFFLVCDDITYYTYIQEKQSRRRRHPNISRYRSRNRTEVRGDWRIARSIGAGIARVCPCWLLINYPRREIRNSLERKENPGKYSVRIQKFQNQMVGIQMVDYKIPENIRFEYIPFEYNPFKNEPVKWNIYRLDCVYG